MTNIRDYLPKKERMKSLQVKLPESLILQVKRQMESDNVDTWNEFLTACFKSYLDNKKRVGKEESINSVLTSMTTDQDASKRNTV